MSKRTRPHDPRRKRRRRARASIAAYWRLRFWQALHDHVAGKGPMGLLMGVSFFDNTPDPPLRPEDFRVPDLSYPRRKP